MWDHLRVPFQPQYRGRTLLVTLIWNCNHLTVLPAVTFLDDHAARATSATARPKLRRRCWSATSRASCSDRRSRRGRWTASAAAGRAPATLLAAISIFLLFHRLARPAAADGAHVETTVVSFLSANAATNTYATELFPTTDPGDRLQLDDESLRPA